jgi:hypothetical protein
MRRRAYRLARGGTRRRWQDRDRGRHRARPRHARVNGTARAGSRRDGRRVATACLTFSPEGLSTKRERSYAVSLGGVPRAAAEIRGYRASRVRMLDSIVRSGKVVLFCAVQLARRRSGPRTTSPARRCRRRSSARFGHDRPAVSPSPLPRPTRWGGWFSSPPARRARTVRLGRRHRPPPPPGLSPRRARHRR